MNFLYEIVTSSYVYILYKKDGCVVLHVLNLKTEESFNIVGDSIIMDVLNEDPEVTFDDVVKVHDIIVAVVTSK